MTDDAEEPTARVWAGEVEVPGTPEDVWSAIATGPGITSWFVPAEVDGREGGRILTDHGPYGRSEGVVTAWQPPHRFAYEEAGWDPDHPQAPPWATELLVEARDGGTCVVRLVSGFFRDGEGWEDALSGTAEGWTAALRNLRLVLTHLPGVPLVVMTATGPVRGAAPDDAWHVVRAALGLDGVAERDRVDLGLASGTVEAVAERSVTLRLDDPRAGLLECAVFDHGGAALMVRGYLTGTVQQADHDASRWRTWLVENVPGFEPLT